MNTPSRWMCTSRRLYDSKLTLVTCPSLPGYLPTRRQGRGGSYETCFHFLSFLPRLTVLSFHLNSLFLLNSIHPPSPFLLLATNTGANTVVTP